MFRKLLIPTIMITTLFSLMSLGDRCWAEPLMPHAPADMSWIPHGYGGPMYVETSLNTVQKGVYGFRDAPKHTAAWSQPMWGWDVNGFYAGPNVPCPDPGELQLPIGLIYPVNGPQLPPPPPKHARRTRVAPFAPYPGRGYPGAVPYPQAPGGYSPQIVPPQGAAIMGAPGNVPVVFPGQQPMGPPAPPVMQYPPPVASAVPVPVGYGGQPF